MLLRLNDVLARTAQSRAGMYDQMAKGKFPKPIKIGGGRINAWVASEVDAWIEGRIAQRDANEAEAA